MKNLLQIVLAITFIFSSSEAVAQCTSSITGSNSFCTGSSTTLTAVLLTGTGTIDSYQWKKGGIDIPGATNVTYQANEAANYKVAIKTKSPSCTAVSPIFTVTENAVPSTNISGNSSICEGNSSLLNSNAIAGSGTIISFQWQQADISIAGATSDTYSATTAGSYTVIVNNSNGCSATSSEFELIVLPGPTATFSGDTSICTGFAASLSIELIGSPPFSIVYNDGTNDLSISGITTSFYKIITAPIATTTYTLKSVAEGCGTTIINKTATVTVNERPAAVLTSTTNEICYGDTTNVSGTITAVGTWTLKLSSGDSLKTTGNIFNIPVSPVISTIYSIYSLTDANCFSLPNDLEGKTTINVKPKLSATITSSSTSICNGEKVFVNGNVIATGDWTLVISPGGIDTTGNGNMAFSIPVSPGITTTYNISSLTNSSCTAAAEDLTGSASVIVNSNLSATITTTSETTICFGDTAYIEGNVIADGPWVLELSPNGIAYGTDTSSFSIAVSPAANSTTNYIISALDAGSCTALESNLSGTADIKVKKKLSANISTDSSTICSGASINLIGTVTAPIGTWTLFLSNGDVVTGSGSTFNNIVSPSITTTYYIDSLSLGNCSALPQDLTGHPQITVSSTLSASISSTSDSICKGSSTNIFGSVIASGDWELELSSGEIINGPGNSFSVSVSPNVNTTYVINYLKEGDCVANGIDITGSHTVTINPIPFIKDFNDTTLCNGAQMDSIIFGLNDTTYKWVNYNPEILTGYGTEGTGGIPKFIAFNSGTTAQNASVTVYPIYKECIGETKTLTIVVNPTPILSSIVIDTLCNNTPFFYKATSATDVNFSWNRNSVLGINNNTSGSDNDNIINETLNNSTDSVLTVSYVFTLTTADGLCQNSDTILVTVNPTPVLYGVTDTTLCNDVEFNYNATSNTINTGFIWERIAADGISPLLNEGNNEMVNETLHNSTANPITVTYKFTLTTADGLCPNEQKLYVTINPTPVLSSETNSTTCNNVAFSYDAESSTISAGFNWDRATVPGISNPASSGNANNINETLTNTTANPIEVSYVFNLTTADGLCENLDTLLLIVNPTPILSSSKLDTVCSDVFNYYNATSETLNAGFSWERIAILGISPITNSGNHQEIFEPLHNSTSNPITVTYVFTISTADDLCSNMDTLHVVVNPTPLPPVFNSIDTNKFSIALCSGSENINFNVNEPTTVNGIFYQWIVTPENGIIIGDSTNPNTVISFNEEGNYTVSVIATNPVSLGSCTSTESQLVIVESGAVDFGERDIILKQPGNVLVYPDNSLEGYQWGYDTMKIEGTDTTLGKPVAIADQVYQVFIPESKFISGDQLNIVDYAFWVLMKRDNCLSKVYYNGPYAHQKAEQEIIIDQNLSLNVYPNPNNGSFNLSISGNIYGNINAAIFNILGERVFENTFFKNQNQYESTLKIENLMLTDGIYMLELTGGNQEKVTARVYITN